MTTDRTVRGVPHPSEPAPNGVPAVGTVIAGKYQVTRVLGAGGMGVVVAAHHLELDMRVAIKFLHSALDRDAGIIARFLREARAAAKITSEHVARVFDVGKLEDSTPYIVMEFLDGVDLSSRLKTEGPLPIEEAVEIVLQAGEALSEAHALGIVHRDLKPANLFSSHRPDGLLWVKVLDFGISKLRDSVELGLTHSAALGTPPYMAPEQIEASREVDGRADIWSLGVVLFELLTARSPFRGANAADTILRVTQKPPPSLREMRPDCPPALEAALSRCLEKDRDKRYGDVGAMAQALLPFAPERSRLSVERILRVAERGRSGLTVPSGRQVLGEGQAAAPADTLVALGQTAARRRAPRALLGVLAAAAGALLLLLTAALQWSSGPTAEAPAHAASTAPPSVDLRSLPMPEPPPPTPVASEPPPPEPTASASGALPPRGAAPHPKPRPSATRPPTSSPTSQHEDLF